MHKASERFTGVIKSDPYHKIANIIMKNDLFHETYNNKKIKLINKKLQILFYTVTKPEWSSIKIKVFLI